MKMLGSFLGSKATPDMVPRGFMGFDVADGNDNPVVGAVLEEGPAAKAGLKSGDVLMKLSGRTVTDRDDVVRMSKKVMAGSTVKLTVKRGDTTKELTLTAGAGL
jgi:putative serine protease PepD